MPSAASIGLPQYGSRQTKIVTIPGVRSEIPGERDNGKSFFLIEMATRPAEKWANRAFLALAHSRADIPPNIAARLSNARGDMRQIAAIAGLLGHIHFPEIEPLMDEIMGCVYWLTATGVPPLYRPINDGADGNDDIEEIATRQFLRAEVIDIHVGFSLPAAILHLIAVGSTITEITEETSPSTRTSRRRSRS
jgi:hypothetical protein